MTTELDEARDKLIERMAHSIYILCLDAKAAATDFMGEDGYRREAQAVDNLLTEFIRLRRTPGGPPDPSQHARR